MIEKINVFRIFKDHITTLKKYDNAKISKRDITLFFVLPILISIILVYMRILLNDNGINILITSFSIFMALLFNLLLLIYDIVCKENKNGKNIKNKFIKEIYSNISFCILISIILIVILLLALLDFNQLKIQKFNLVISYKTVTSFAIYVFISNFILTMTMILKRIYILLSKEFEN